MRERPKHIEDELERQYKMLAEYDRLLGHTTDPIKREEYLHFSEIVRENIARLEQGFEALPLPTSGDQLQNIPTSNLINTKVTILLEGDIITFTPIEQASFIFTLSKIINLDPSQIRILKVMSGSIRLEIELPESAAKDLIALVIMNNLKIRKLDILQVIHNGHSFDLTQSSGEQPAIQVFICYSKVDDKAASELYERLHAAGYKPWRDEEDLLPGQDWKRENRRALKQSRVALVLLSQRAVRTAGYNNALLGMAVEVADEQPDGTISLIPLRLDECELPGKLEDRHLKPLDYFKPNSFERLLATLKVVQAPTAQSEPPAPESPRSAPTLHPAKSQDRVTQPAFSEYSEVRNHLDALVDKFLDCPSLARVSALEHVVEQLPKEIRRRIDYADTANLTQRMGRVVEACLNTPGGVEILVQRVAFFDKGTIPFNSLLDFLKANGLDPKL